MLMFIYPFRQHIGSLYFQTLITTGMAHAGTTVGANLEVQMQQILIGVITSAYIIGTEGIVHSVGKSSSVNYDLAAKFVNATSLTVFCFIVATVYAYMPRLSLPLKINATSVYIAFTRYRQTQRFDVRPLPGYVYAQLIGALISTFVNICVFPSTASYNLMGSFRELLTAMTECCQYFVDSVSELGVEGRRGSNIAAQQRVRVLRAAERFGHIVGGSRYEASIERFSQVDYHFIFLDASRLASSFSTMCLPFEIDDSFYYQLEDPAAQVKYGSMTTMKNRSATSLTSFASERPAASGVGSGGSAGVGSTADMGRRGAGVDARTLQEVAEMHRLREIRNEGVQKAIETIRSQIKLHHKILQIVLNRTEAMENRSPTKSLLELVARMAKRVYTYNNNNGRDGGLSGFVAAEGFDLEQDYSTMLPFSEGKQQDLHDQLAAMSLEQMADVVDQHIELYEQTETECIGIMAPYSLMDDIHTHEKHVVLLSFIGAMRENAICLTSMLRTIHRINTKRPDYVQFWLPKLSWSWLYSGRIDDDEDGGGDEEDPVSDTWSLENAYGTTTKDDDDIIDDEEGEESELPESQVSAEMLTMNAFETYNELGGESVPEVSEDESDRTSGSMPRRIRRHSTQVDALYQKIEHPFARAARAVLDWSKRPKTRYTLKFTVTMMVWAIWAFIGASSNFFKVNSGVWGMTCIGAVFGVTIGSTFNAGFNRVLGTVLSGSWGIVAWRASNRGRQPYLPCFCCIIYFVISFYVGFFVPKWSSIAPVMVLSFSSVLFTAYKEGDSARGTSLGWKHVAVNAAAILFTFVVSSVFMPYKARTALRARLAELLRLNSQVVQGVNFMHVARAEFPTVHRNELKRVRDSISRSRILIVKCRRLIPSAIHEPSVHEKFQLDAHHQLIDTLEVQLEWLLYSFFTHATHKSDVLGRMIRLALAMREDIVGSKAVFNSILASALSARMRLPAYLPDIGTARLQFRQEMHPLLVDQYTRSFDITYLSRWKVGIWHLIATQTELYSAVRAIVGAETDRWPEEVGFMLDCLEQDSLMPGKSAAETVEGHGQRAARGQWFSRLPKYARLLRKPVTSSS
ncbi:hypothetical protein IWW50_001045 [Coemansia erecta]|nr:hypothetical protein IWW50_001045 [Coemansia erecta]